MPEETFEKGVAKLRKAIEKWEKKYGEIKITPTTKKAIRKKLPAESQKLWDDWSGPE